MQMVVEMMMMGLNQIRTVVVGRDDVSARVVMMMVVVVEGVVDGRVDGACCRFAAGAAAAYDAHIQMIQMEIVI